jgi:AcrR family transcriptional regulator
MSNKAIQNLLFNRTKTKIIETAERLFAEKGINNVSTREIAREAGQKNHSALHYHFGDKENLLDALLDYRLTPLDNKRKYLLDEVLNASKNPSLRELITVLITPMAENALDPKRKNYILKIMGELLTSADWRKKYAIRSDKAPTTIKITNLIFKILKKDLGEEIAFERLRFMAGAIMVTIEEWSISSTSSEWAEINNKPLGILDNKTEINLSLRSNSDRIKNLADFIIGAITYQSSSKSKKTTKLREA